MTNDSTRRLQTLTLRATFVTVMGCTAVHSAAAEADPSDVTHVRASNPAVAGLIREATARSSTFRHIVEAIDRTNGIVYVEEGECIHGARACLKMWMSVSGGQRFLRVLVDPRRAYSDADLMGSIGHELQHATEALSDSAITDGVTLYNFFRRLAPTDSMAFETTAAINAGDAVRDEVRRR